MGVVYNFDKCRVPKYESEKPPLYIITPTYPRPVQIAELTRLAYVLQVRSFWIIIFIFSRINLKKITFFFQNVKNLHWIVADDAYQPTINVLKLLEQVNVTSHYILSMNYEKMFLKKFICLFFHLFHSLKNPQINFSCQNFSIENN